MRAGPVGLGVARLAREQRGQRGARADRERREVVLEQRVRERERAVDDGRGLGDGLGERRAGSEPPRCERRGVPYVGSFTGSSTRSSLLASTCAAQPKGSARARGLS